MAAQGTPIGSAVFIIAGDPSALIQAMQQSQQAAQQGSRQIQSHLQQVQQTSQSVGRAIGENITQGLQSMATGLVAFETAKQGLDYIVQKTRDAQQAQFTLNRTYGASAQELSRYATQLSAANSGSATSAKEAAAAFGSLSKNYGYSTAQIKTLLQVSADLAAVHGTTVAEAANRLQSALRGEGEAAEYLGLTLNSNAVQAMAKMTDEQRKNYQSLNQIEQSQIIYNELLRQAAPFQGTAAERAHDQAGAQDRLNAQIDNTAVKLGTTFVPLLGQVAIKYADLAESGSNVVGGLDDLGGAFGQTGTAAKLFGAALDVFVPELGAAKTVLDLTGEALHGIRAGLDSAAEGYRILTGAQREWQGQSGGGSGGFDAQGPSLQEQQSERSARRAGLQQDADQVQRLAEQHLQTIKSQDALDEESYQREKTRLGKRKQDAEDTNAALRDSRLAAIHTMEQASDREAQAERTRVEVQRDHELQALSDERDAALKSLDERAQAARVASEAAIQAAERERDASLKGYADERDAALATIAQEQEATVARRQSEDRGREDARRGEDRTRETAHQAELDRIQSETDARSKARKSEQDGINARRDTALRDLQDERDAEQGRHDDAQRDLDLERTAAQAAHDLSLQRLSEERDAEQRRHDDALKHIQAETDARTAAIDREIAQLDAEGQAQQDRSSQRALQREKKQASADLATAQAAGDPAQIAQAQQRVQDLQAQQRDAARERERTARRQDLEQQKADAQDAGQARQQQLDTQQQAELAARDGQQQAADAALAAQLKDLDTRKQAEADTTQATLKGYDQQAQAARDAADAELAALSDRAEKEQAEDQARQQRAQAGYQADSQRLQDLRLLQDRERQDERAAEDAAYQARQTKAQDTYQAEADALKVLYEGPGGILERLKQSETAQQASFDTQKSQSQAYYTDQQRQLDAHYNDPIDGVLARMDASTQRQRDAYAAQTTDANTFYTQQQGRIDTLYGTGDPTGSGLLDNLQKARDDTHSSLVAQATEWQTWHDALVGKDGTSGYIGDALKLLSDFTKAIGDIPNVVVTPAPDQPQPRPIPGSAGGALPSAGAGGSAAFPVQAVIRHALPGTTESSHGTHEGGPAVDIYADRGEPIYAPVGGTSSPVVYSKGGNTTTLQGDNGLWYYFAHGNVPFVGGPVTAGQVIGQVGDTGNARGGPTHVHFAITDDGDFSRGINGGSGNIVPGFDYWNPDVGSIQDDPAAVAAPESITVQPFGSNGPAFVISIDRSKLPGGDVQSWLEQAIAEQHVPETWLDPLLHITAAESGQRTSAPSGVKLGSGDPKARNPVDVGNGEHAEGLLQTIPSTFEANRLASLPDDIDNPVSNAAAAIGYIRARYGDPWHTPYYDYGRGDFRWANVPGYAAGGWITKPTLLVGADDLQVYARAGEAGPERIHPATGAPGGVTQRFLAPISVYLQGLGVRDALAELNQQALVVR